MKNFFFLIILASFFMLSCKKETISTDSLLTGEWRWVSSTGGFAGKTITPSTEGFERKLVFTANMQFSRYKNNVLEKSGSFEITKGKSIYKTELVDFIKFDDGTNSVIISQTADELQLADNFNDGFGEVYQRIK